tara:strand:+ start:778 stop:1212 length:435 start_codon:yes stop_codon:yes gene_type:complete
MALPVTQQLTDQLNKESVGDTPTTPMDGNVSRPQLISDLLSAMKDINFSELVGEYSAMAGTPNTDANATTNPGLMAEIQTPATPLATQKSQQEAQEEVPQGDPDFIVPAPEDIPTPMTDAMNIQPDPNVIDTTVNSGLMKPAIA